MNAKSITAGLKKYPVLIGCGALTVVLAVMLYVRGETITEQQAELDGLTATRNKQLANISGGARLDEQVNYLVEANKAALSRSLPLGGIAQNLQYFYRIESEIGLKYSDLRQGAKPSVPPGTIYVPLAYTIAVDTDFEKAIALLRRLESGVYFSRINSGNIGKSGSGVQLTVNVDLLGTP